MEHFKDILVFDQSSDKFVFNLLFNLVSRIYKAAIRNYSLTHQEIKAAHYFKQYSILTLSHKYFNVTLEPFQA